MTTHDMETEQLRQQLEAYKEEKERIRKLIDQLEGPRSKRRDKVINVAFVIALVLLFVHSILREFFGISLHVLSPVLSLELAVLLVSLKIIWMIHLQNHIEHFQFWILNSLEFQVSLISKRLTDMEARTRQ